MAALRMKGGNEHDTLWTSLKDFANAGCYSEHTLSLLPSSSQSNSSGWCLGAGRELMGNRKMKHGSHNGSYSLLTVWNTYDALLKVIQLSLLI